MGNGGGSSTWRAGYTYINKLKDPDNYVKS